MRFSLIACGCFALLSACSDSDDILLAEKSIPTFHEMLDGGRFHDIYASSSKDLKNSSTEEDMITLLERIHGKLGQVTSSEKQAWLVNHGTQGTFATLTYKTAFEHGKASEKFIYRIASGQALLAGYFVTSNDLLSK